MWTFEYEFCKLPFDRFNPAQEIAIPYANQDVNLVISFPTATGKSAIAYCAFGYHLITEKNSKVVYVSPYRSLSMEKYNDFNNDPQFNKYGITINTGDFTAKKEEFEKSRMIILTNESFDVKSRNHKQHNWLDDVSCLVLDEAHLLGQKGRGDVVESSLMRFTKFNPDARIILLSATMKNEKDIAKWIKKLNNKRTIKIKSDFRPTAQEIFFHTFDDNDRYKSYGKKIEIAVELAKSSMYNEKMIIFVHSKKLGSDLLKELKKEGIPSAFHNASLRPKTRKRIEEAFSSYNSGLNILVSTSTLSTGVNL